MSLRVLPLDRIIVDLYDLQKGDEIKAVLLSVLASSHETKSKARKLGKTN